MSQCCGDGDMIAGIGGSGRQSATKLAAFMAEYELFMIEITKNYTTIEWREDIKKVLLLLHRHSDRNMIAYDEGLCQLRTMTAMMSSVLVADAEDGRRWHANGLPLR